MKLQQNKENINEKSWYGLFYDEQPRDKSNIKKVNMVSTTANQCKVFCDGNSVYSNSLFYPGDIVEICPTKQIDKSSLYSRDMRDIVFEVIPNEMFVIPFGYSQYYDIISRKTPEPNCDYLWDPETKVIVIKALQKIPRKTKLILNIKK